MPDIAFDAAIDNQQFRTNVQNINTALNGLTDQLKLTQRAIYTGLCVPLAQAGRQTRQLAGGFKALFGAQTEQAIRQVGGSLLAALTDTRSMKIAVNHLTSAFSQMAQPIAQAVSPALAALTNGFAKVMVYAGRLFAFLSGRAVKSADAASAAVTRVSGATAKAARTLAGFDEINRLDAPRQSGSGSGSGGAAGSGLWSPHSEFLDQVLETIEGGDWEGAGRLLAKKLNSLLASWNATKFGRMLGQGLQNALDLFNEIITGVDWNALGRRLANGFNGLLQKLDFADLATFLTAQITILVRTVGSFLERLDWAQLGQSLSAFAAGFWQNLSAALTSVDWRTVGAGIRAFFAGINWAEVMLSLGEFFASALRGAMDFAIGLFCGTPDGVEQTGAQIVAGFLLGILRAIAGIGGWIYDNIFLPFMTGFCTAFGIHSPSTVAAGWGENIVLGLLEGITATWTAVAEWFGGALSGLQQLAGDTWTAIRETTTSAWNDLTGWLGAVWQSAVSRFTAAWSAVAGWFGGNVINPLLTLWQQFAGFVDAIWSGITGGIRLAVNGIIGLINNLVAGVIWCVNAMVAGLNQVRFSVPSWVPGIGGYSFGFALSPIATPQIPYLAQGAVIPANREFLAVLGDQTHGTNVEAPLAVIEQAVANVLDSQLDALMAGFEAVVAAIQDKDTSVYIGDTAIGQAAARYQQRRAVIRGGVV